MSKSSEEGAANTPPQETATNNDKDANKNLYENRGSTKKIVRVLTVVAYVFSVSFAAIMLSAYYVFLWKPPNPRTIQGSPLLGEPQAERLTSDWSGTRVEIFNVSQKHGPIQKNDAFGVGNDLERRFTAESNGKTDGDVAGFDRSATKRNDVTLSTMTTTNTMSEPLANNDEPSGKTIDEHPKNSDNSQIPRNAVIIISGNDSPQVSMIYGMNNNRTTSRFLAVNADANSPSESKKTVEESTTRHLEYSYDASAQQIPGKSTSVDDNEGGGKFNYKKSRIPNTKMQLPRKMSAQNVMASISRTLGTRHDVKSTAANEVKFAGEESKDKLYEPKHKQKVVRVLTVIAYVISVSLAAIILSLYYMFLWDPKDNVSLVRSIKINVSDKVECANSTLVPTSLLRPILELSSDMTTNGSSDDRIIDTTPASSDQEHGTRGLQDTDSSAIQSGTSNDQAAMLNTSSPTIPDYQDTRMSTARR